MRLLLKSLLAMLIAVFSTLPALASETRVVPANRPSAILFYYAMTEDSCYAGAKPKVHFTGGPTHGTVTTAWQAFRVPKGKCAGKPARGTLIIYRPTPGYHGTDKVSVIFSGDAPSGYFARAKEWILNITVK